MPPSRPRVALFVTCLVDLHRPSIGFAAIRLLEQAGCHVEVPRAQTCCGQPAYNSGDRATTRDLAEGNFIRAGHDGELDRWTEFSAEALPSMDPTRRLARLTPKSTSPLGRDPGVADAAAILLAAEQIGAATRCLDLTVDYTKERQQFGRPIGSFQALKHRMADLYVAVQAARAVVNDAADGPSPTSAALARVAATEAFNTVAAEGIQLHGGIAITWEHDMQLYFKRAHGSSQLLGPAGEHLRRLESEVFSPGDNAERAAR